jgi:hypothetical protein
LEGDDKLDRWNSANDPRRFGEEMEYDFEVLKEYSQGASSIQPWPDTYWPMTKDGYNWRWQGHDNLSPAELYDRAFNDWVPSVGFEEFLALYPFTRPGVKYDSEYYDHLGPAARWAHYRGGNNRARSINNPDGTLTNDVDADGDGIVDRDLNGDKKVDDDDKLGGLEGWWGHCHAWAPAAFSAPEPQHSVTIRETTFTVADIKALIEATFEGGGSVFLGGRCNLRDVERDEHGRIVDEQEECRDTNAGAFHVVLTNVVGRLGKSFVADVTFDYQVWNHPVRDYTINVQEEVDVAAALELLGRTDVETYPYNDDATRFVHVVLTFRYVVEGSASPVPYLPMIDYFTVAPRYEYLPHRADWDGSQESSPEQSVSSGFHRPSPVHL